MASKADRRVVKLQLDALARTYLTMQNLLSDLTELLSTDDRLVAEGKLLKNKVVELALNLDGGLLSLLLKHQVLKAHFFVEVGKVLVFDKIKFQRFVSNKAFLPDSFTTFKNKIGLALGDEYLADRKEVVLAWPYKDCVLEGGQERADGHKRKEIFWNETLAPDQIDRLLSPKVLVNIKRFGKQGEVPVSSLSVDDNLLIKGNNLLAMHTLKHRFSGEVKLIFIDPPFNTENDTFQYNDSFSQSTWLTFLRNRLEVAKHLLANDGSIFVHIDHDNNHPVKLLMDEIFGSENFRNEIILPGRAAKGLQKQFDTIKKLQVRHDVLFWYTKNESTSFKTHWVDKHDVGNTEGHWHHAWSTEERKTMQYELLGTKISKGQWVWGEGRALQAVANYDRFLIEGGGRTLAEYWRDTGKTLSFIRRSPDDGKPQYWRAPADTRLGDTVWTGVPIASNDHGFKTAKNEKYLAEVIRLATQEGDLVLDFFGGSGTTMATAHKMKRRWIGVEQLEYAGTNTLERLKSVVAGDNVGISGQVSWQGGGEFVYCELGRANQIYVDQIQNAKEGHELLAIWQIMQDKAFLSYKVEKNAIDANNESFNALNIEEQKQVLIQILDKNLLYVPLSEMEDETFAISEDEKRLNKQFFGIQ